MDNLARIQKEVREWAAHNFPDATWDEPFMGIVEEVGELSHALLKHKQGIRGMDVKKLRDMEQDAIGDILIFMIHFCALRGYEMSDILAETWGQVRKRDWKSDPEGGGIK